MFTLVNFAKVLLIIGGVAWGIYGAIKINIIRHILPFPELQKFVYILVGIAALFLMFNRNYYFSRFICIF
jgi:uncharacterized membrane protein YuzA (DUF378 family)